MSPYTAQLALPRLGESKRYASFYDLQARFTQGREVDGVLG